MVHNMTGKDFHELRSALGSIQMASELISPLINEEIRPWFEMVVRNSDRMKVILDAHGWQITEGTEKH